MIKNIIWDADGTLFDTYPQISAAFCRALNQAGYSAPFDWIDSLARKSLDTCFNTLVERFDLNADEFDREFDHQYGGIGPKDQPPFPGVIEICEQIIGAGGKNFIVTHRRQRTLAALLSAHDMTRLFSECISAADGYAEKPDPAMFNVLIDKHRLGRQSTLAIGDREIDVQAGKAAGLVTCLFGSNVKPATADYCITDYGQLKTILAF
jgi:HAD superfamily hydrolase (TIGR01509 family)